MCRSGGHAAKQLKLIAGCGACARSSPQRSSPIYRSWEPVTRKEVAAFAVVAPFPRDSARSRADA